MSLSIAIVGSGPAGFYAVEGLCKQLPDCRIDMIDRLPTPFGLVRSGVAPDHQTTKNVVRVFDRLMEQADIRYLGNVELGRDLSMAELKETYDAVILAIGASGGRRLGLAGGDAVGVYTADTIVGWYNGHPDYENLDPVLPGPGVAVFGIGNVALDVARLAASTAAEFAPTDIAPYAADAIEAAPISEVHIIGRRGPVEAAFSKAELAEMGEMVDCVALVDGAQLPDEVVLEDAKQQRVKAANLKILQSYADNKAGDKPVSARFHFFASPVEFLTEDRDGAAHLVGVRLERTRLEDGRAVGTGETYDLAVSTAVLCIGYKVEPPEVMYHKDSDSFLPLDKAWIEEIQKDTTTPLGGPGAVPDGAANGQALDGITTPPNSGRFSYASARLNLPEFLEAAPNSVKTAFADVLKENHHVLKAAVAMHGDDKLVGALSLPRTAAVHEINVR